MTCERGSCQPDCAAGGVLGGARVNAVHAQDPSTALQVRDEVSFPLGSRMTKSDASVLRSLPSKDNQHKKKSARSRKRTQKKKTVIQCKMNLVQNGKFCLTVCTTLVMGWCVHVAQLLQFLSAA